MAHTPTPWYCGIGELVIMANPRPGCQHKRIAVCDSGTITEQADYDNRDHIVKVVNQYDDLVAALTRLCQSYSAAVGEHNAPQHPAFRAAQLALATSRYIAPAGWAVVES